MNELILKTKCYLTTQVGTQVTRRSTKTEWETYGEILRRVDEAKQWAIGDWLLDGKQHYADGLYKRAAEVTGQPKYVLGKMPNSVIDNASVVRWRQLAEIPAKERAVYYATETRPTRNGLLRWRDSETHESEKIAELLDEADRKKWRVAHE